MNPDHFSDHLLLYHAANKEETKLKRSQMVRANNLFGQLNHVRKDAENEKAMIYL